ncbi:MAG: DUF3552 domain-containing protein, partial [Bacteroidetes bacterium]|nr:DUF3552 domain-containing protein [Bacteroidota bacterium]
MTIVIFILSALVLVVGAFILGQFYAVRIHVAKRIREADQEAKNILANAVNDAETLKKEKLIEVSDEWYRKRQDFEDHTKAQRTQIKNQQDELLKRERSVEQKGDVITRKDKELTQRETLLNQRMDEVSKRKAQLDSLLTSENQKLEQIARMTSEDAKKQLMANLTEQARSESAQMIRNIKEEAQTQARDQIRNILLQAINRTAIDHT